MTRKRWPILAALCAVIAAGPAPADDACKDVPRGGQCATSDAHWNGDDGERHGVATRSARGNETFTLGENHAVTDGAVSVGRVKTGQKSDTAVELGRPHAVVNASSTGAESAIASAESGLWYDPCTANDIFDGCATAYVTATASEPHCHVNCQAHADAHAQDPVTFSDIKPDFEYRFKLTAGKGSILRGNASARFRITSNAPGLGEIASLEAVSTRGQPQVACTLTLARSPAVRLLDPKTNAAPDARQVEKACARAFAAGQTTTEQDTPLGVVATAFGSLGVSSVEVSWSADGTATVADETPPPQTQGLEIALELGPSFALSEEMDSQLAIGAVIALPVALDGRLAAFAAPSVQVLGNSTTLLLPVGAQYRVALPQVAPGISAVGALAAGWAGQFFNGGSVGSFLLLPRAGARYHGAVTGRFELGADLDLPLLFHSGGTGTSIRLLLFAGMRL